MERCGKGLKRYEMLRSLPWSSSLKALKSALRGQVTKHTFNPSGRYFYVVRGPTGSHLVLGDIYCSCLDFYLNVVIRKKRKYCYHIAAVNIAEEFGSYSYIEHKDPEFIGVIKSVMASEGLDLDP